MKKLIYIILLISFNTFSQTKFITKSGIVNFEASVPSFEEVAAKNNSATAILNTEDGEFAALVLVKGFRFKNALMEEHFNENYAESDKYPKATFKGKIDGFLINKLSDKPSVLYLSGALTFHGKTKTLEKVAVNISKKENQINITGNFTEKASSFDIKIPKIVRSKIANDIEVTFEFFLKSK